MTLGVSSQPVMNIYSGHDTSLLALASALNVEIERPRFSSCIMLELHDNKQQQRQQQQQQQKQQQQQQKQQQQFHIEIYFRNNNTSQLKPLTVQGCTFKCPLDKFIKLSQNRVSVDRTTECGVERTSWSHLTVLKYRRWVVVTGCVCLFCFVVVLWMILRCKKLPPNPSLRYVNNAAVRDDDIIEQERLIQA